MAHPILRRPRHIWLVPFFFIACLATSRVVAGAPASIADAAPVPKGTWARYQSLGGLVTWDYHGKEYCIVQKRKNYPALNLVPLYLNADSSTRSLFERSVQIGIGKRKTHGQASADNNSGGHSRETLAGFCVFLLYLGLFACAAVKKHFSGKVSSQRTGLGPNKNTIKVSENLVKNRAGQTSKEGFLQWALPSRKGSRKDISVKDREIEEAYFLPWALPSGGRLSADELRVLGALDGEIKT